MVATFLIDIKQQSEPQFEPTHGSLFKIIVHQSVGCNIKI